MKTWTEEEVRVLLKEYNQATNAELAALLPSKSAQGIYKKARKLGLRKTQEIERRNRSEARKREKGANWNGGIRLTAKGYRQLLVPGHPRADSSGYVMEHILVWEAASGVPAPVGCCVHHLNEKKDVNRIENLCLMVAGAHTAHHNEARHRKEKTENVS